MKTYQTVWRITCGLLAMVGVTAALLFSVPAMLVVYVTVAITSGLMTLIYLNSGDTEIPRKGSGAGAEPMHGSAGRWRSR